MASSQLKAVLLYEVPRCQNLPRQERWRAPGLGVQGPSKQIQEGGCDSRLATLSKTAIEGHLGAVRVEMDWTGTGQSTTREQEAATGEVETPLWRFNGEDGGHNLGVARKARWRSAEMLTASWSLYGANLEAQATCITLMSTATHNDGLGL